MTRQNFAALLYRVAAVMQSKALRALASAVDVRMVNHHYHYTR